MKCTVKKLSLTIKVSVSNPIGSDTFIIGSLQLLILCEWNLIMMRGKPGRFLIKTISKQSKYSLRKLSQKASLSSLHAFGHKKSCTV
jgi:hypothetical protein